MNVLTKALPLAVIAAVALMGCGKEAPPPPPVQAAPAPAPATVAPVAAAPAAAVAAVSPTPAPASTPAGASAAMALAGKDLAAKSGCLTCHAVDKKVIGPAFKDIANKYKASDEAMLIAKVKAGGKGVWGPIPMPPNVAVKDEDIKTLVSWILAGAK